MRELKDALTLVERARNKRAWEPRKEMTFATTFPEFTHFRSLNRFLTLCAVDVGFTDGNEKAAITALLDSFRVCDAACVSGTLIGVLVSRAGQAMSLRAIEKHVSRFSLLDCKTIAGYVDDQLKKRDDFTRALGGETNAVNRAIESMFKDLDSDDYLPEDLRKRLADVPASLRGITIANAKTLYAERIKAPKERFEKGEKEWATYLDSRPPDEESNVTAQSPIEYQVVEMFIPALDQVLSAALLRRVQMRLLRAAMAVMTYRWTYGKLPPKLDGIAPDEVLRDPITGANFRYRVRDEYFELIGTGSREHGEIRLLYRRTATNQGGPPPPY